MSRMFLSRFQIAVQKTREGAALSEDVLMWLREIRVTVKGNASTTRRHVERDDMTSGV